jgi:hypothetical protein
MFLCYVVLNCYVLSVFLFIFDFVRSRFLYYCVFFLQCFTVIYLCLRVVFVLNMITCIYTVLCL